VSKCAQYQGNDVGCCLCDCLIFKCQCEHGGPTCEAAAQCSQTCL
jgi:hypothetical protein